MGWLLAVNLSAAAVPLPPAVARAEAGLWDNPVQAKQQAAADLANAVRRPDDAAVLGAALRLTVIATQLEDFPAVQQGLASGVPITRKLDDRDAACLFKVSDAAAAYHAGRTAEAYRIAGQAVAEARDQGLEWCAVRMEVRLARFMATEGRSADELAATLKARQWFELQQDKRWIAGVLSTLSGLYAREDGNPHSLARAIDLGEKAIMSFDGKEARYLAATSHHNLAEVYLLAGRFAPARQHAALAQNFAQDIGDTMGTGYIASLRARIDLHDGKPALALPHYEHAKAVFTPAGLRELELGARLGRVRALAELKRLPEALRELEEAEPVRLTLASPALSAEFHLLMRGVLEASGNLRGALDASKAHAEALVERVEVEDRRSAQEMQERFETQRKEDENKLLREEQRNSEVQQRWLVGTVLLTLALLAGLVLHLLQQRRLRARLKLLAERDDLTGLPNRRHILQVARRSLERRRGNDARLCLAVLDIDHFKAVNDTHGHAVGDAALVAFARACQAGLRQQDELGRFGGEEFLAVLPGAQPGDMQPIFDRLRAHLHATAVGGMPAGSRLSFSMGCTVVQDGEEIEDAIRRADGALYSAKTAGRDRLVAA